MKRKLFLISLAFVTLCVPFALNAQGAKSPRKIAVQTYSMRAHTLEDTARILPELGVNAIEAWGGQKLSAKYPGAKFNADMTPEQKAFAKKILAESGIKIISFGVANPKDEAEIKKLCEFAKEFDIPVIVTESAASLLPLWNDYCGKYGLKMCIHNHQRGSVNDYYNPEVVMKMIAPYANIGACPDNGGWARSGLDPVKCFKIVEGKVIEVHFKDQKTFGDIKSPAAAYGKGSLDMKAMLAELDRQKFDGYFVIEHGDDSENIAPVIKTDVEFLKSN